MIDFESLKNKKVLEIGVGNGSHAALLAKYAKDFTGIDLTDYAITRLQTDLKFLNLMVKY
ncbi:MAG: class I SAM-dependent methyltransferase [Ignavibacteriales bacterium]|nr:class I SAM-dependent methyltransferase [Ignavibacteriales bacterium]